MLAELVGLGCVGLGPFALGCTPHANTPDCPPGDAAAIDRPDAENLAAPADAIVPRDLEKIFGTPSLAAEMMGSPFVYFRKVNTETVPLTCAAFEDALRWFPPFDLHGDAHLEQFAVSSEHHGLSDYDDVATGPGVVDLVRFGASVYIAGRMRGWSDDVPALLDEFIDRYLDSLAAEDRDGGSPEGPAEGPAAGSAEGSADGRPSASSPPSIVPRLRRDIPPDRASWLRWVDSVTTPVESEVAAEMAPGAEAYRAMMLRRHADLGPKFFDIKRVGHLDLGVGSRLHPKFLLRMEGPTPAPNDDVVVEFKSVTRSTHLGCVSYGGATAIVRTMRLFANEPVRFIAQVPYVPGTPLDQMPYWAREWLESYAELRVADLDDVAALREVVHDVATELGSVHPRLHGDDTQARREQMALCATLRDRIKATIVDIGDRTWRGWEAFAKEAKRRGLSPKKPAPQR
ncbi:MAG: DUF2252 family protein [Myxococcota bacterium]